ncbi:MlaE family ABC transporter permease [Ramlibacter sp. Leaf400]|uniref:MlaE family ABC transporter permease n=1 Tax=Ramlibacter sp. Leaf400 TaxID=1736365 RepID=UPI0006F5D055|nr:ABC transporter permease [Ramlibacter sp. Leaf400]KQT14118.1 ABC transporter permease [Ramlibacter sp. Leaf400]
MTSAPLRQHRLGASPASAPLRWLLSWWDVIFFGAVLMVLALSPSSYRDPRTRAALARHAWTDTAPILLGFSMLCALLTVVLTRIVVVTAQSYGLSQYALEMVIRVLVLELIPLTAALFVALRCTIPNGAALAEMRRSGRFQALRRAGVDPLVREVLPRMLAGAFSTITLAALSCFVAAVLAYLAVYQLTPAGLPAYTRMFGHVFNPSVSMIFAIKTAFFALAVSTIPMASGAHEDTATPSSRESAALQGLVRMFAVLLLLESVSLVGNYY